MPFSYLFQEAPHWQLRRNFTHKNIPIGNPTWIYEQSSLTQRLRAEYGPSIQVSILKQGWHIPFIDESRLIGIRRGHHALIREVVLHAEGIPLILARSVIPTATIAIAQRDLSHLGNRPLGEIIFSYPDLQRHSLEIVKIDTSTWTKAARNRFDLAQSVWGRRTKYAIQQESMLVSEFFLSALLKES